MMVAGRLLVPAASGEARMRSCRRWERCALSVSSVLGLSGLRDGVRLLRGLGSAGVVKPSISEAGSSARTPLLSKHTTLSPGQVGSHTNVEGVCHLLSTVSLLQYGELVLPSVQSCYDGAGTVVVVVLGPCAVCTFNVVCSPGFAARMKAVQELNHLADTSCVLFVRAFVNVEKANVVHTAKRLQLVHFFVNVQTNFHKMVFPVIQVRALTVKQFTLLRQVPYILLELVVRCLKR